MPLARRQLRVWRRLTEDGTVANAGTIKTDVPAHGWEQLSVYVRAPSGACTLRVYSRARGGTFPTAATGIPADTWPIAAAGTIDVTANVRGEECRIEVTNDHGSAQAFEIVAKLVRTA